MEIYFHTNLDEAQGDVRGLGLEQDSAWKKQFGIPPIGSLIQFNFRKAGKVGQFHYDLEVKNLTFNPENNKVIVLLGIPSYSGMSIATWTTWIREFKDKV
jgi:hypothetical protein